MALKDVAKGAGMTAGKAHPYMASFLKVGFVTQTDTGHYELGPLALQLGLARLRRLNPVREASPLVEELATSTGHSVALAIWGNLGPTIVRLEEPVEPLHINLRTGTVMALSSTATGRLFGAYLPPKVVERLLERELERRGFGANTGQPMTREALQSTFTEIREQGLSRSLGQPIPGIDAFCAPVFDAEGHIVLGVLVMGLSATFDSAWDGVLARSLKSCAGEISKRLGHI
jgi:DNA-binding IclR family transcriptional regulator